MNKDKVLLDLAPFCVITNTVYFGLRMTALASVDSSSPALFCCLCIIIPRTISWVPGPDTRPGISQNIFCVTFCTKPPQFSLIRFRVFFLGME